MQYTQLPPTYKNDTIAEAIYAREIEFFHYEFDANNFRHLLTLLPEGPYQQDVQNRLNSTLVQMANVDAIYHALVAQITDPEDYAAAVLRTTEKRKTQL